MASIDSALENFAKIIADNVVSYGTDQETLTGKIAALQEHMPDAYDESSVKQYLDGRAKAFKRLVDEYFMLAMAQKLPVISPELFNLKRHLYLKRVSDKWTIFKDDAKLSKYEEQQCCPSRENYGFCSIRIPLFAYTPLFGVHVAKLGKFFHKWESRTGKEHETSLTIEAKLPGHMKPELKDAYRNAMSHYYSVLSRMFTNPVAGDILYSEGNLLKPEIGAIWIPTSDSLNLGVEDRLINSKPLDPAMILKARGNSYLVRTWVVDDEDPFEHYLKGFTTKDYKNN